MDIVCFSHLRWNFVYQRPQHLLSRFSMSRRVYFIEEPVFNSASDFNEIRKDEHSNTWIVVPHLQGDHDGLAITERQKKLVDDVIEDAYIRDYIAWYYTPMALAFTSHLAPSLVVYDCMDELSAFKFAPPALRRYEEMLLEKADVVFTGGVSLYEAKKHRHQNIHAFPSSIDKNHFATAREIQADPADQASIPHPRIGFYGVLDERLNLDLLGELSEKKRDWHFVLIGPVVKIDEHALPKAANLHYLGGKSYKELPSYLAGWDIAMMPFALNESTAFISPTKTPEYLAGGKPVISTSIRDVVRTYGENGLVYIADTPEEFISAAEQILQSADTDKWLARTDELLANMSWDQTCANMMSLIEEGLQKRKSLITNKEAAYV